MAKIHWSVYLILGGVVLFAANYLSNIADPKKYTIFVWFGYFFLAFGTAKFLIWFITRKKEPKSDWQYQQQLGYPRHAQNSNQTNQRRQHTAQDYDHQSNTNQFVQQHHPSFCTRCGQHLKGVENFCSRCGTRLR
ncbi:MAG TPA: zinc ribbon domain-containing protein [Candidatus Nanoarchaeia archaeon]|nr:zinc ribbon domain-containing protein [Candidatus Nanoarchaeia archaeon]